MISKRTSIVERVVDGPRVLLLVRCLYIHSPQLKSGVKQLREIIGDKEQRG